MLLRIADTANTAVLPAGPANTFSSFVTSIVVPSGRVSDDDMLIIA